MRPPPDPARRPLRPLRRCRLRRLRGRRPGPGPGHPAVDVALPAAGDRHLPRPDVVGQRGARRDVGAVGDVDRRDDDAVGADEAVPADARVVLRDPVVVGEDRPGPDVGPLADGDVTGIREVRDLRAVADRRVLRLDETADLPPRAERRPGPQVGVGADGGVGPDDGEVGLGPADLGPVPHLAVGEGDLGADDGALADARRAEELAAREDGRVAADRHVRVDPGRGRVDDRHAVTHPPLADPPVELGAEPGELDPVVDALGLPQVGEQVGADPATGGVGDGDDVGEVALALGVVGPDLPERLAQDGDVEGVDAGVDLGDGALLLGRVLLLDDADDPAVLVADDPAVAGRVPQARGDDGDGRPAGLVGLGQRDERLAAQQRDVAVGDEDGPGEVRGQGVEATLGGPAGALDLVLVGDDDPVVEGLAEGDDLVAPVPDDDGDVLGAGVPPGPDGVAEERSPADAVEDLRRRGLHPRPLARGEDDDGGRVSGHAGCSRGSRTVRANVAMVLSPPVASGPRPGGARTGCDPVPAGNSPNSAVVDGQHLHYWVSFWQVRAGQAGSAARWPVRRGRTARGWPPRGRPPGRRPPSGPTGRSRPAAGTPRRCAATGRSGPSRPCSAPSTGC